MEECEAVLGELEMIKHSFPLSSLEAKEDAIDGAEILLQVSVLLEPLLPEENGSAITREIQHIIAQMVAEYEDSFYATVIRGRGCPALDIHEYQLRFLLENFFTMKDIAGMFSCSTRTIQIEGFWNRT